LRWSDGKKIKKSVRHRVSKKERERQFRILVEECGHIWNNGNIDTEALEAFEPWQMPERG